MLVSALSDAPRSCALSPSAGRIFTALRCLTGSFGQLTGWLTAWRVSNDAEVIYIAIGNGEKHLGTFPPRSTDGATSSAKRDVTRCTCVTRSYRVCGGRISFVTFNKKRQPGDQ